MKNILKFIIAGIVLFSFIGCDTARDNYKDGRKAYEEKDFLTAAGHFQKACTEGEEEACNELGIMYDNGEGVEQNYQKAFELKEKGCLEGSGAACYNVGIAYNQGMHDIEQNDEKAELFFRKGCENNYQKACDNPGAPGPEEGVNPDKNEKKDNTILWLIGGGVIVFLLWSMAMDLVNKGGGALLFGVIFAIVIALPLTGYYLFFLIAYFKPEWIITLAILGAFK